MFHKYDFGTASQITSRRWANEVIEPEVAPKIPVAVSIVIVEVCAIVALLLIPHFAKSAAFASQNHKVSAHSHHVGRHIS